MIKNSPRTHKVLLMISSLMMVACHQLDHQHSANEMSNLKVSTFLESARKNIQMGQLKLAVDEIKNAMGQDPDQCKSYSLMGQVHLKTGDYLAAEHSALKAKSKGCDDNETHLVLAESYLEQKDYVNALNALNIQDNSENKTATGKSISVITADIYSGLQDYKKAQKYYDYALEINPNDAFALLGQAINIPGLDLNTTLAFLTRAVKISPSHHRLWMARAGINLQLGYTEAAINDYKTALDILSDLDVMTQDRYTCLSEVSKLLIQENRTSEAFSYTNLIEHSKLGILRAAYEKGVEAYRFGYYEEAKSTFEKLISVAPNHSASRVMLGATLYKLREFDKARSILSHYKHSRNLPEDVIKLLAMTQINLGNPKQALTFLKNQNQRDPEILMLIGASNLMVGDTALGEDALKKAFELAPENSRAARRLAKQHITNKKYNEAIKLLQDDNHFNPGSPETIELLIRAYQLNGLYSKAYELVKNNIKMNPNKDLSYIFAGTLAYENKEFKIAEKRFRQALALNPLNTIAIKRLGKTLLDSNQTLEAYEQYLAFAKLKPSDHESIKLLLSCAEKLNKQNEALKELDKIAKHYPSEHTPNIMIIDYHLGKKNYNLAIELAKNIYNKNHSNPEIKKILSLALQHKASENIRISPQKAYPLLEQALEIDPQNFAAAESLAYLNMMNKQWDKIENIINHHLKPERIPLHSEIKGDYLFHKRLIHDALIHYLYSWRNQPTLALAKKIYNSYSLVDEDELSIIPLKQWNNENPDDTEGLLFLAKAYENQKNIEMAISVYEQLLIKDLPLNIEAYVLNNLSWLSLSTNPSKALKHSTKALSLQPNNPNINDTYGLALIKSGHHKKGLEHLEMTANKFPNHPEIQKHLSDAKKNFMASTNPK